MATENVPDQQNIAFKNMEEGQPESRVAGRISVSLRPSITSVKKVGLRAFHYVFLLFRRSIFKQLILAFPFKKYNGFGPDIDLRSEHTVKESQSMFFLGRIQSKK